MKRAIAGLLLLTSALFASTVLAARTDKRPNVVVLCVDDLGYGELGCQGNRQIPTPHIDSLSAGGVRFTQGYVTASYCSPSRAGLLTGRYQTRFGYEFNPVGKANLDPKVGLPASEWTLAQQLGAVGYQTAIIGKWHLGGSDGYYPQQRGFDTFFGFLHEGHFYVPPPYNGVTSFLRIKSLPAEFKGMKREGNVIYSTHIPTNEPPYDADNPIIRGRDPLVETKYLTDALTREAVAFIDQHREEPFFLYLAYNAVHSPMQGADAYMKKFSGIKDIHRRVFAAMLGNLDDSVGTVLDKLRAAGLEEDTLIFLVSDNGGPTRELTSSNLPLRGGKGQVYEGGIRVPFMVQWKGNLPAGKTFELPVISTDIYATASAVAEAKLPEDRQMDSVNLLPYLRGKNDGRPHETLFWRMGTRTALRHGDWKIVRHAGGEKAWELYNLAADLGEQQNLAAEQSQRLAELKRLWADLNAQMKAPAWSPGRR